MKKVFLLLKYQECEHLDILKIYENLPSVTRLVDLLKITPKEAQELLNGEEVLKDNSTEFTVYELKEYTVEEEEL